MFEDENNHIDELRLERDGWHIADLSALTGAPIAFSPLAPYVRSDGINSVVYQDANNHIVELRLERDGWHVADLIALVGG